MEIKQILIEDAAMEAGLEESAVRSDYSGRGMYGKTCLGVVYDNGGDVHRFIESLHDILADDLDQELAEDVKETMLDNQRGDSMGLSAIAYWPGIQVTS